MQIFVEKGQLSLKNNTYLVTGDKQLPVNNREFYKAQKRAAFIHELSKEIENHNFKSVKASTIDEVLRIVENKINASSSTIFVETPKIEVGELTTKLKQESLAFLTSLSEQGDSEVLNKIMQEFLIIKKFEDVGLYFDQEVVELNHIYTIGEILINTKKVAKHL